MYWIPFAIVPFLLAAGIAWTRAVPRWGWFLLIGIIASAEIFAIGKPSPSWEKKQVISLWVLAVLLPWGVVAAYIAFAPYAKKRSLSAIGLPVLYFLLLGIGLVAGDGLGFIPQ